MKVPRYLALGAALLAVAGAASAQISSIGITVDENGNGTISGFLGLQPLPASIQADPGPGGLPSVLTYDLLNPPGLVAGDVLLQDGVGGPILDVVRFNSNEVFPNGDVGALVFYSDNIDGFDALGDTPGPPAALYTNVVAILEVGTETANGAIYTPLAGQPGFVAGASAPVVYNLLSDISAVPEPGSVALFVGIATTGTSFLFRRRRR